MGYRFLFKILPWILLVVLGIFFYLSLQSNLDSAPEREVHTNTLLNKVEALGKLELVKYNFQEITEVKEISPKYFQIFQLGPDSKIVLISSGEAVGCVDLSKIKEEDIVEAEEEVLVTLPPPELCYFKLNLEKTRIYALETGYFIDEEDFIQNAYRQAEKEIREAAITSGILTQTQDNAMLLLEPLFQSISNKKVTIRFRIPEEQIKLPL